MYLIVHVKKKLCESKKLGAVSEGANIGMSILGTFLTARIFRIPIHLAFTWLVLMQFSYSTLYEVYPMIKLDGGTV